MRRGTVYNYSYCATCGMLDGITGPSIGGTAWSLAWGFGPDHQLTSFTDANGNKTTYSYGNALELTSLAYPDSSGFSYAYNNQQNVSQVTSGQGHVGAHRMKTAAPAQNPVFLPGKTPS